MSASSFKAEGQMQVSLNMAISVTLGMNIHLKTISAVVRRQFFRFGQISAFMETLKNNFFKHS